MAWTELRSRLLREQSQEEVCSKVGITEDVNGNVKCKASPENLLTKFWH